jgi:hypothetical protein
MKLYTICNNKGRFYSTHYNKKWSDKLEDAKIYKKEGTAKAQITCMSLNCGEVPQLVILETIVIEVIPQDKRVQEAIENKRIRDLQYKKKLLEMEIDCKTSELLKLKQRLN